MYQPVWFDYNKMTDELLHLGGSTVVQMNVLLYNKDMKGVKKSYHNEYVVENNYQYSMTLKRTYHFYLSISNTYNKTYAIITVYDIVALRLVLDKVSKWFETKSVFKENRETNELTVQKNKKPIRMDLSTENKFIEFSPIVLIKETGLNTIQTPGVTLNMYGKAYIDLTVDKFYGMKYLFDTVDMFTLASNMLNYIGRPEYGTNMVGTFNFKEQERFFSK